MVFQESLHSLAICWDLLGSSPRNCCCVGLWNLRQTTSRAVLLSGSRGSKAHRQTSSRVYTGRPVSPFKDASKSLQGLTMWSLAKNSVDLRLIYLQSGLLRACSSRQVPKIDPLMRLCHPIGKAEGLQSLDATLAQKGYLISSKGLHCLRPDDAFSLAQLELWCVALLYFS